MDENLTFLYNCSNDQLRQLADILVFNKDGQKRLTENLSSTLRYQQSYPDHMAALVPDIVEEYRKFGSNTILNMFTQPKSYKNILADVCKQMKVPCNSAMPVSLIEQQLLQTLVYLTIEKLNEDDIAELLDKTVTKAELLKPGGLLAVGSPLFLRIITAITIQISARITADAS